MSAPEILLPEAIEKGKTHKELISLKEAAIEFTVRQGALGLILEFTIEQLVFFVHLSNKYPLKPPKLTIEAELPYASISDGRDLLEDIFPDWSPSTSLPSLHATLTENISTIKRPGIGKFHLGESMYLNTWSKRNMRLFQCIEEDPQRPRIRKDRAIVISHSHILQFDVQPQAPGVGYLICYSTLSALAALKKTQSEPPRIILQWKPIGCRPTLVQYFTIADSEEFLEFLVENMKMSGISIRKQARPQLMSIIEDEVNPSSLKRINIADIIREIGLVEQNLYTDLKYAKIDSLIKLYQQAVEYYSAINDKQFDLFLQRMQQLMKDERVLKIYLAGADAAPGAKSSKIDVNLAELAVREHCEGEEFRDYVEDSLLEDVPKVK